MRKIPETLNEEELKRILDVVKNPKHKLAFALGFYEGLRVSEVVNLLPEHIDRGRKLIMIKQGKGNKDRNIPIAREVVAGLKYLPVGVGVRALQISFKRYCELVLKRDMHFHCLRHSSATHYMNKKGWSTRQVQTFLGHSRITTTEIYTHVNPQDLIDLMWD